MTGNSISWTQRACCPVRFSRVEDTRIDYDEQRFQAVGFLARRMVMVIGTPRGETAHVMSMRKCNDEEQARYSKRFEEG